MAIEIGQGVALNRRLAAKIPPYSYLDPVMFNFACLVGHGTSSVGSGKLGWSITCQRRPLEIASAAIRLVG